jgi:hypothetical protein
LPSVRQLLAFLLLLSVTCVRADDPPDPIAIASTSAASLIGLGFNGGPGCQDVAVVLTGIDGTLWPQRELDAVVPLRSHFLSAVHDLTGLGGLATKKMGPGGAEVKVPGVVDNPDEDLAFRDAIIKASRTSTDVFAQFARRDLNNSDFLAEGIENFERDRARARGTQGQAIVGGVVGPLAWRRSLDEPRETLRGAVVHFEGTLRRVNPQNLGADLEQAGVAKRWEGWVLDRNNPRHVWYIIFTELPENFPRVSNENLSEEIEFDGYYMKVLRSESLGTQSDPHRLEEAVVVVGRSPVIKTAPSAKGDPWSEFLAPGIATFFGLTVVLVGLLTWSFRRSDRKFRARLEANRTVVIPDVIPGQLREEQNQGE